MRLTMKTRRILAFFAAAVLLLPGCKSEFDLLMSSHDIPAKYKAAMDYFNKGKYSRSASLFESLSVMTAGLAIDDTVQYYWGLSNYRNRDYYTAETNFGRYLDTYPRSVFSSEARYLRLDCLYRQTLRWELDQNPTRRAIQAIQEYNIDFPDNGHGKECAEMLDDLFERLDIKAFEAAKLYYNMEDYLAARVALKNVLKDNADNRYREDILYYIAKSSYNYAINSVMARQSERYVAFKDDYFNFVGEYGGSRYRRELDALYARAQKSMGNYAGDTAEGMTEQDFARERKAGTDGQKVKKAKKSKKGKKK